MSCPRRGKLSESPIRPIDNYETENEINEENERTVPEAGENDAEGDQVFEDGLPDLIDADLDDNSDEETTGEARKPKVMRDPGAPTQAEVDQHNITHLPFRPWCSSCVSGQARDKPHRRDVVDDKAIDEIVFDYFSARKV